MALRILAALWLAAAGCGSNKPTPETGRSDRGCCCNYVDRDAERQTFEVLGEDECLGPQGGVCVATASCESDPDTEN